MTQAKTHSSLLAGLPFLVDGLTLLAMLIWLPALALRLEQPSGWNAMLLVLLYLLFCLGIYLIRKLESEAGSAAWQAPAFFMVPKIRAALAFMFGLLMMTTLAYQIGYFDSIRSIRSAMLDEGDSSALLVYMPGALLGFSMLYILILAFPVQASISENSRKYPVLAFFGLLFANGMLFFTTSQARAIADALDFPGGIPLYIASFLVLLISFAPPRLLYQNKQPYPYGLFSFSILLIIASWQVVN